MILAEFCWDSLKLYLGILWAMFGPKFALRMFQVDQISCFEYRYKLSQLIGMLSKKHLLRQKTFPETSTLWYNLDYKLQLTTESVTFLLRCWDKIRIFDIYLKIKALFEQLNFYVKLEEILIFLAETKHSWTKVNNIELSSAEFFTLWV